MDSSALVVAFVANEDDANFEFRKTAASLPANSDPFFFNRFVDGFLSYMNTTQMRKIPKQDKKSSRSTPTLLVVDVGANCTAFVRSFD